MSYDSKEKDVILLGARSEILAIDFMYVNDEEIACIMEFVHDIMWQELLSRSIRSMAEWSSHAQTVFTQNGFSQVGHIIGLTKNEVNRLKGCGYITRMEIYNIYKYYGLIMPQWEPGVYYEKQNNRYKFVDDDEELIRGKDHDV